MGYTKDIILDVKYKNEEAKSINKNWTNSIWKLFSANKFIVSIVMATICFMILDIILVNNFIVLLSTIQ